MLKEKKNFFNKIKKNPPGGNLLLFIVYIVYLLFIIVIVYSFSFDLTRQKNDWNSMKIIAQIEIIDWTIEIIETIEIIAQKKYFFISKKKSTVFFLFNSN